MTTHLTVLRQRDESRRFARQEEDDARTAIDAGAARSLEHALKKVIDGEVRFDKGTRALYATDGSNYRQAPIGVVVPRHVEDVVNTVRLAREHGAPILSRGGGTSLGGQCCNVAVVIDFSKYMHEVVEIDAKRKIGRVQPGCVLDHFRETAHKEAGLFFGPDPATHSRCTIGGMLGNNSCGSHSLLSKNNGLGLRMSDNTHALEVLLYDGTRLRVGPTSAEELEAMIRGGGRRGEIYGALKGLVARHGEAIRKMPQLERRVSGYNLNDLLPESGMNVARALVGSESTLVTILEAELHLVPAPKARTVVMLGFEDFPTAAECGLKVLAFKPIACEGIDHLLFQYVKQKGDEKASLAILPKGQAFLLVEFAGESKAEADGEARRMMEGVKGLGKIAPVGMKLYDDPQQEKMIWDVREGGLGSTAWVPGLPDSWPGWEDSAVPVEAVPQYVRDLRALFEKYDYHPSMYGHIGQGCVHCRVPFDLYTHEGIEKYKRFMGEAVKLVVRHGGVASGEHGDGQARGQFWPEMFSPELMEAFRDFKRIFDAGERMNPGKTLRLEGPPYGITDNLRIGPDYNPPQPETYFAYQADKHSFARAALRCVGVGECRREGGGTMCPSYMVTREEKDSTRGRARMLFEMMNGEIVEDGWRSEEVKESLDLCLSCKGCKGDCPVNVDMATYKAEFLAHYYKGRVRPRHAYAFGFIHVWARLASLAPGLANLVTQLPGLRSVAKLFAGVHRKRRVPAFATQSFKHWFRHTHRPRNVGAKKVLLFADTFNNYFHPDVAIAATHVLEDAGFEVLVPTADVCCGRPLYDYGFLATAKRWWLDMLEKLRPYYREGIPMVVLEPSCWAAFQDELTNMLPTSEDAKRLKGLTFTLSDFLRNQAEYAPPRLQRKAIVHGHCHQKAMDTLNDREFGKLFAEKEIFKKMGLDDHHPDAGCCGMAGAFGYEKENGHYELGVACGERAILPEVREAPAETLIVADGFSCQEMIEQETSRVALHMAHVLHLAKEDRVAARHPEKIVGRRRRREVHVGMARAGALLTIAACAAGLLLTRGRGRRRLS